MDIQNVSRLRSLDGPILITGHTGFKGTWLTFLLERMGVETVGYSLAPESDSLFERTKRTGVINEAFADIRDVSSLKKFIVQTQPSAVIHMAAQPLVLESYRIPNETFSTNVMGTVNLLDASFESRSIKSLIVITTDKVYRNGNSGRQFIETDPLEGKDPYSASKVGTEAAIAAWQQIAKISGGPNVTSARAGNVIGGGDWSRDRLLPDLIRSFSRGQILKVRNPKSTRPWQHVLDPLAGYLLALEASLEGKSLKAINFGPASSSLEVSKVVDLAMKAWPGEVFAEFVEFQNGNNSESVSLGINSDLARSQLGWNSVWTQSESVESTIQWWDKVINENVDPVSACLNDIDHLLNM